MTLEQLTLHLSRSPCSWIILAFLIGIPVLSRLLVYMHGKGNGALSPWRYIYAVMVYAVSIPGIFAVTLTAYMLFFTKRDLMQVNFIVFLLPAVSMILSLVFIRQAVAFDALPGFDRLWGLMIVMAITFGAVLAIQKTRIWVFFGSSFLTLIILVIGLFLVLKYGAQLLVRRREDG